MIMRNLTSQEKEVLRVSGELFNMTIDLPRIHAHDQEDICFLVRQIQSIIHARPSVEQEFGSELRHQLKHPEL